MRVYEGICNYVRYMEVYKGICRYMNVYEVYEGIWGIWRFCIFGVFLHLWDKHMTTGRINHTFVVRKSRKGRKGRDVCYCCAIVALCGAIVALLLRYCCAMLRYVALLLRYPPKQCGALRPKKGPGGRHITECLDRWYLRLQPKLCFGVLASLRKWTARRNPGNRIICWWVWPGKARQV